MTTSTDTPPVLVACPLGCGRRVAAQGDAIHYCVFKTKIGRQVTTSREYVGTWDGAAMFYGDNHHDVELQMADYRAGLFESGLIDQPSIVYAPSDDPFDDGPSQEEQAASAALWKECEGGWEQYTPDPFDPSKTVRLFQPRLFDLAPTASPAALPGEPHAPAAALAAPDIGESLWGEFHDDPVAFLTLLGTFGDKARDAVNQAVAAYLECPVSEVVGIWGESRARAVRRGMLS